MVHHTGTGHVHVDIGNALPKMAVTFHGGCMIAVLPERTFSVFTDIVLLAYSTGNQLE